MRNKSSNRFVVIFVLISMLAAFPFSAGATHAWGNYHWARTSNPFTLKLGDNVSGAWDAVLVTTSSDWSQSTVLNTTIVAGTANPPLIVEPPALTTHWKSSPAPAPPAFAACAHSASVGRR